MPYQKSEPEKKHQHASDSATATAAFAGDEDVPPLQQLLRRTTCTRTATTTPAGVVAPSPSMPSRTAKGGRRKEQQTLVWREKVHSTPRVRLLLDSQTGQLVNTGQLVKVSSQLWSKLQKWLNKRGKIGNWTGIKLLIN